MEKYIFKPYDKKFKLLFQREKDSLVKILPKRALVEHVGSTAVPGLGGKGIIDIAIFNLKNKIKNYISELNNLGFKETSNHPADDRRIFMQKVIIKDGEVKMVHIHLCLTKQFWDSFISFRDYLRKNNKARERYAKIKKEAVTIAQGDAEKYRAHKNQLLTELANEAMKEYNEERKIKKELYSKIIDFTNHKTGLYNVNTFVKDWGSEPRKGVAEKRCKIVKVKGEKVLEITIPKGTESNGGSFWRLNFPRDLEDVTFEYDIMFGKNFNFVRGGKLPGLGGGTSKGFGGTHEEYQNGFSARLMWREIDFNKGGAIKKPLNDEIKKLREFINSNETKEKVLSQLNVVRNELIKFEWHCRDLVKEPHKAFLVQYMYYPDKEGRFGENLAYRYGNNRDNKVFVEPNKWYTIKMRIKLSENPKQEDSILAWVDGRKVLDKKRNLRKEKSYGINQVMFSLFFGGDDETWHTKKDEKVYFRKFVIKGK